MLSSWRWILTYSDYLCCVISFSLIFPISRWIAATLLYLRTQLTFLTFSCPHQQLLGNQLKFPLEMSLILPIIWQFFKVELFHSVVIAQLFFQEGYLLLQKLEISHIFVRICFFTVWLLVLFILINQSNSLVFFWVTNLSIFLTRMFNLRLENPFYSVILKQHLLLVS